MLKGLTLRDIGRLRRTSEATIRQRAQGVCRRSGLANRAELAACFLEICSPSPKGTPQSRRRPPAAAAAPGHGAPCRPGPSAPFRFRPAVIRARPPRHRSARGSPRAGSRPGGFDASSALGASSPLVGRPCEGCSQTAAAKGTATRARPPRAPGHAPRPYSSPTRHRASERNRARARPPSPGYSPRPHSLSGPTSGTGRVMPPDRGRNWATPGPRDGGHARNLGIRARQTAVASEGGGALYRRSRGCSSMVEPQPSKLKTWVRFPSPAPPEARPGSRAPAPP